MDQKTLPFMAYNNNNSPFQFSNSATNNSPFKLPSFSQQGIQQQQGQQQGVQSNMMTNNTSFFQQPTLNNFSFMQNQSDVEKMEVD